MVDKIYKYLIPIFDYITDNFISYKDFETVACAKITNRETRSS